MHNTKKFENMENMDNKTEKIYFFLRNFLSYIDSLGGTNFWNRLQNIHNCWAGDTLWDFEQLGVGSDLLDWGSDGSYLMR